VLYNAKLTILPVYYYQTEYCVKKNCPVFLYPTVGKLGVLCIIYVGINIFVIRATQFATVEIVI